MDSHQEEVAARRGAPALDEATDLAAVGGAGGLEAEGQLDVVVTEVGDADGHVASSGGSTALRPVAIGGFAVRANSGKQASHQPSFVTPEETTPVASVSTLCTVGLMARQRGSSKRLASAPTFRNIADKRLRACRNDGLCRDRGTACGIDIL